MELVTNGYVCQLHRLARTRPELLYFHLNIVPSLEKCILVDVVEHCEQIIDLGGSGKYRRRHVWRPHVGVTLLGIFRLLIKENI